MGTSPENDNIPERRLKSRFKCDYPAWIQGQDEKGKLFQVDDRAANRCRNGVCVIVNNKIPKGMELSIRIALTTGFFELGTSKLVLSGQYGGASSILKGLGNATIFDGYRFL
jgi:hypothetical protein